MTSELPKTARVLRIERVAAILFGSDAEGAPRAGWKARLADELHVAATTIMRTLRREAPEHENPFDHRLGLHLENVVIPRMTADIEKLAELAKELKRKPKGIVGVKQMMSELERHGVVLPSIHDPKPEKEK